MDLQENPMFSNEYSIFPSDALPGFGVPKELREGFKTQRVDLNRAWRRNVGSGFAHCSNTNAALNVIIQLCRLGRTSSVTLCRNSAVLNCLLLSLGRFDR